MPGLCGIIGRGSETGLDASLELMLDSLKYEEFYKHDKYCDDSLGVYLGWTYFVEDKSYQLPLFNEKKDIIAFATGQLFNSVDDINWLKSRNHDLQQCRYNTLVHLYEEKGEHFVEKLNGLFSGLLLDLRNKAIYIFNDRYGFGRIYYLIKENIFYFSTEAKALLRLFPETRQFDFDALSDWLTCGAVLGDSALFKNISIIPPASLWKITEDGCRKGCYFCPEDKNQDNSLKKDLEGYFNELRAAFERVIPKYLNESDDIGFSVTGGKDTRIILAFLNSQAHKIKTYTFGSKFRKNYDEKIGSEVAEMFGMPHSTIKVGFEFLKNFPRLAEKTVYISDGLMDVSGAPDLYANSIARNISLIRLNGNYGQEIIERSIAFKPSLKPKKFLAEEIKNLTEDSHKKYQQEKLQTSLFNFIIKKQLPWFHYNRYKLESSQLYLYSPFLDNEIVELAGKYKIEENENLSLVRLRLYAEVYPPLGKIPTDRGYVYQRSSFLDRLRILFRETTFKAEYAYDYGMPQWATMVDNILRPLNLGKLFLGRHKFYHFRVWYRDDLREYVRQVLLDKVTLDRPYLDKKAVQEIVDKHTKGIGNYTLEIHKLLTLEMINRTLFKSE